MPELRNTKTGAVVSCSEETAARLGTDWQPVEDEKLATKTTTRRKSSSQSSD